MRRDAPLPMGRPTFAAVATAVSLVLAACSEPATTSEHPDLRRTAGDSVVAATDRPDAPSDGAEMPGEGGGGETVAGGPTGGGEPGGPPFRIFGETTDGEGREKGVRRFPVRLVNRHRGELIVVATAGAEDVVVDSLAPGDSVPVNLESKADSIVLYSLDHGGRGVGGVRVVYPDSVRRRLVFP